MRKLVIVLAASTLAGCSTLAVEADVSSQLDGDFRYIADGHNYHGAHVGRLAVSVEPRLTQSLTATLGVEHTSLLDTGSDRGQERAFVGLKWRPFKPAN